MEYRVLDEKWSCPDGILSLSVSCDEGQWEGLAPAMDVYIWNKHEDKINVVK